MGGSCWARLGAAAERRAGGVAHDGEDAARLALPHILLVVRVLRALQTTRHTRSPKCTACHAGVTHQQDAREPARQKPLSPC